MKEIPILFSSAMVRAILAGKKTMMRRVVKPKPDEEGLAKLIDGPWIDTAEKEYRCPYGHIGDRLWVRETFCKCNNTDEAKIICYRADNDTCNAAKWHPSIYMPRSASRITLEVTGVKVERLQKISAYDLVDEGVEGFPPTCLVELGKREDEMRNNFQKLWDSINAKRPGCSWAENPWVWVIEFKG